MTYGLETLIELARQRVAAMTDEERAAMFAAQRESWVRGEMALGAEERKTTTLHAAEPASWAEWIAERDALRVENALLRTRSERAEAEVARLNAKMDEARGIVDQVLSRARILEMEWKP